MHFAIIVSHIGLLFTVGYCPNELLLNTDSGDLFHLFVYKTSCKRSYSYAKILISATSLRDLNEVTPSGGRRSRKQ